MMTISLELPDPLAEALRAAEVATGADAGEMDAKGIK
jgi:hypothetical protein